MKDESHGGGGSPPVTRRRWVDALLGGSLVAWAGAVIYPVLKYLTPPRDAGGAGMFLGMLIAMLYRRDHYTGKAGHSTHVNHREIR